VPARRVQIDKLLREKASFSRSFPYTDCAAGVSRAFGVSFAGTFCADSMQAWARGSKIGKNRARSAGFFLRRPVII